MRLSFSNIICTIIVADCGQTGTHVLLVHVWYSCCGYIMHVHRSTGRPRAAAGHVRNKEPDMYADINSCTQYYTTVLLGNTMSILHACKQLTRLVYNKT